MTVSSMGYGNMILYLPVLEALRERVPELRLLLVADRSTDAWQALDTDADWLDVVWTNRQTMTAAEFARLLRAVRAWAPDTVLLNANAAANPHWVALMRMSGAAQRIGLTAGADLQNTFRSAYTSPMTVTAGASEIVQNLQLLEPFGISASECRENIAPFFSLMDASYAEAALHGARGLEAPVVGLHLTSSPSQPWKRWAPEHFATLAGMLRQELGAQLVLLGGTEDRAAVDPFSVYDSSVIDLVGRTETMRQASAVIAQLDLLVAGDTGLMQAASALGTPTVVIIGPTDFTRTVRRSAHVRRVSRGEACSPCFYRSTQENPSRCPHRNCLELLKPESVLDAVRSMLSSHRPSRMYAGTAVAAASPRERRQVPSRSI